MSATKLVFLGTDSGATTSKTGAVWADGSLLSTDVMQSSTNSQAGREAVVRGWVAGAEGFLKQHGLTWAQVGGVGLAIPGPYKSYGVLERTANLPASFEGWNFVQDYSAALEQVAGRKIPLIAGNDGNYGGVSEAARVRGNSKASVLMLMPGSGLGVAFVDGTGVCLEGDTLAGMEGGHMPAPLHLLGLPGKPFTCGCGKDWGCVEAYTTISGLPQLLAAFLPKFPDHPLAKSDQPIKEKVLSLRTIAQKGDPLALAIFDFQAKVMGLHIANLAMALDPKFVVLGGGLMDTGHTTPEFRERYLQGIRAAALPYLWPAQRTTMQFVPASLGDLSQAIGAALMALYQHKGR